MSIETTHKVYREHAIRTLRIRDIPAFDSDSNQRLAHELYKIRPSILENYEVVNFTEENDPAEHKWRHWKTCW
jgi:hypothetical protein